MTDAPALSEPPLTPTEADRRLPTLALIDDDDIRVETRRLSRYAPAYFWERPGSTAGNHNAHAHGLWLHTLKLSSAIARLAPSWLERGRLHRGDVDRLHAAAILHDQRKEGAPSEGQTLDDHDRRMAAVVREESSLDAVVARLVETHMGAWGEGPNPASDCAELLHAADMMAADDHVSMAIQEPVPIQLRAVGAEGVDLS